MTKGLGLAAIGAIAMLGACSIHGDSNGQSIALSLNKNEHLLHTRYGLFDPATDAIPDLSLSTHKATAPAPRAAHLVQFTGHIRRAWRDVVAGLGVPVRGYL